MNYIVRRAKLNLPQLRPLSVNWWCPSALDERVHCYPRKSWQLLFQLKSVAAFSAIVRRSLNRRTTRNCHHACLDLVFPKYSRVCCSLQHDKQTNKNISKIFHPSFTVIDKHIVVHNSVTFNFPNIYFDL